MEPGASVDSPSSEQNVEHDTMADTSILSPHMCPEAMPAAPVGNNSSLLDANLGTALDADLVQDCSIFHCHKLEANGSKVPRYPKYILSAMFLRNCVLTVHIKTGSW